MTMGIQQSPDQILTTMTVEGKRIWLRPRLSTGRFLNARRLVAYGLMVLFFVMPFGHLLLAPFGVASKQWMLLDIPARRFTICGYTFLPTDTLLLALFMLAVFVSIFLITALVGRLWCGWGCPQTVYLEFLYRPIERLFEGTAGRGGRPRGDLAGWRKPAAFLAAAVVSLIPAHTFLAYFVPAEKLLTWITGNPFAHPTAFLTMAITTALMLFDFYYFREQLCLIACPYGRFQSVLLDKWSMIVSYDKRRGEPRKQFRVSSFEFRDTQDAAAETRNSKPETRAGDCVDCRLCVTTCPTGIDIRQGLQMECVNCTQCIDACDAVMDKLQRPRGLIRYSSQAVIDGEPRRLLRPRVILYPLLLVVLIVAWLSAFASKGAADVTLTRNTGNPYFLRADGLIGNPLKLKIVNRTDRPAQYVFHIDNLPQAKLDGPTAIDAQPGEAVTAGFVVAVPADAFTDGQHAVTIRVEQTVPGQPPQRVREASVFLLGPRSHQP